MTDEPDKFQNNAKDLSTIINSHLRLYKTALNFTIYGGIGLILFSLGAFRRIKTISDLSVTDLVKRKKLRCMVKGITDKGDIMVYHTPFLLKLCFFPFTKYKNDFITIKPLGVKYNEDLIKSVNEIIKYKTTLFFDPLAMDLDNNIVIGTVHIPRSYLENLFHIPIINSLVFTDFAKYLLSEGMCEFSLDSIPIYPNPYENFENKTVKIDKSDEIIVKSLRLYKKYERNAKTEGKGIWSNNIQIVKRENFIMRVYHWFF